MLVNSKMILDWNLSGTLLLCYMEKVPVVVLGDCP